MEKQAEGGGNGTGVSYPHGTINIWSWGLFMPVVRWIRMKFSFEMRSPTAVFFVFWFPLSTPPRERSNSSKNSRPRTRFRFDAALYELKAKIERGLALCLLSRVAMATSRGIVCPWFPGKQSHFYVHECVWEPAECTRMVLEYIECTLFIPASDWKIWYSEEIALSRGRTS